MKVVILILIVYCSVSTQLSAQNRKYDPVLDSIWSKNAYIKSLSPNGEWALIIEYSDYKSDQYKVMQTKGSITFNLGACLSAEISADSKWVSYLKQDLILNLLNLETREIISLGKSFKYRFNSNGSVFANLRGNENENILKLTEMTDQKTSELIGVNDFFWNPVENILIAVKQENEETTLLKLNSLYDVQIIDKCNNCSFSLIKWSKTGKFLTYLKKEKDAKYLSFLNLEGIGKNISEFEINNIFPDYKIGNWDTDISDDGKLVFFYRENSNYSNGENENVEIWDTDDKFIYPRMKSYNYRKRLLLSLWNTETGELMPIEDEINSSSYASTELPFSLVYDIKKYEPQYEHYPYADIYILNLISGKRELLIEKHYTDPNFISISPFGDYISFFKDANWWLYKISERAYINLTKELNLDWSIFLKKRIKNPHLVESPFWTEDNKFVILHDQYDVWQIGLDGKFRKRLTKGRESKISYRIFYNKNDTKIIKKTLNRVGLTIDLNKTILLQTEAEFLKTGISVLQPGKELEKIFIEQKNIENLINIKDQAVIYSQNIFNKAPEFYRMNLESKKKFAFHEVNPELNKYDHGHYEIFTYSTKKFKSMTGVLIYPANYDPSAKYPMIVRPYENNSKAFYDYTAPSDRNNFNIYRYIHNGYFVLLPDIEYEIGRPGFSALECVEAAVYKSLKLNKTINQNKIGLVGHSFGGYEAAFIATQTSLFKAVVAGAPVTDMISFYHDIWWELETDQAWRMESQQFRMGESYYNLKKEYNLNSPLFHVEKLKTPLLLWTGKNDTNINWYQSVFMYSAMRRLNKIGRLIIFNDDDHSLTKKENQERLSIETFNWFETYLK